MNFGNSRLLKAGAGFLIGLFTLSTSAARADTVASLLGNFTINQYCGLTLASESLGVHYVVVFGQLPALRELHLAQMPTLAVPLTPRRR